MSVGWRNVAEHEQGHEGYPKHANGEEYILTIFGILRPLDFRGGTFSDEIKTVENNETNHGNKILCIPISVP